MGGSSRITRDQVRHVAALARLSFTAEEEKRLELELSAILSYVEKLNELDTATIEPTAQVGEAGTPFRDDLVTNQPDPEAMLANAPAREGRFFRVPRIIE